MSGHGELERLARHDVGMAERRSGETSSNSSTVNHGAGGVKRYIPNGTDTVGYAGTSMWLVAPIVGSTQSTVPPASAQTPACPPSAYAEDASTDATAKMTPLNIIVSSSHYGRLMTPRKK